MKVLLIQKVAGVAGSENYLLNLLPGLLAAGIDAHFLCVQARESKERNKAFLGALERAGVRTHVIESSVSISWSLIRSIRRLIERERYDIVHTNLIHADIWAAIVKLLFIRNIVIISVKHGYSEKFQKKHGLDPSFVKLDLFSILTRWAAYHANRIVTISDSLKTFLSASGLVDPRRCEVIFYGLPANVDQGDEDTVSRRFGAPQIVIVGRLVEVKQHHLVIDILPALVRRFSDLKLVILGAGPLESELKARAEMHGVAKHIQWEGFRSNVGDYLRASDVMLMPSAAEGFGSVVLEAWRYSVPVVAFDVPALNEIIDDGETGILVPPFDTTLLFEKLITLLAAPKKSRAMGKKGEAIFKARYTIETMVNNTISIYRSALNEKQNTDI